MFSKIIRIYFSIPFAIIFCLGILLLIPSILFGDILKEFWRTFFHVVGVAFIAVALTAPIAEFFQYQTLSEYMGILRGAGESEIVHIFRSRFEDRDSFQKTIEDAFDQADKVLIGAIGLPRLFHHPPYPEPIKRKLCNPNIPIKILLLDPKGENARERERIEIGSNAINEVSNTIFIRLRDSVISIL